MLFAMEPWKVCLLGVPYATRSEQTVRLRGKETRALLACLLLPARLSSGLFAPPPVSRQTLAERFWDDKPDGRVCLRQAVAALKAQFGEDCFQNDANFLQVCPGAFITDLDLIRAAYAKAIAPENSPEMRLSLLIEADGEIGGPFLEGCLRVGHSAEPWLIAKRAEVHEWIARVLFALADAFEAADNLNGAMGAARRAAGFVPESEAARDLVWRLAHKSGQRSAHPVLKEARSFEQALVEIAARGTSGTGLTSHETRFFDALFKAKCAHLPPRTHKALIRLSVLPAPFSPELALSVCRVGKRSLRLLTEANLLQTQENTFVFADVVRAAAWRQAPTPTKNRLQKRMANVCGAWAYHADYHATPFPGAGVLPCDPFFRGAVLWGITQPVEAGFLGFLRRLHAAKMLDVVQEALPFLEKTGENAAVSDALRYEAMCASGSIYFSMQAFEPAALWFERAHLLLPRITDDKESEAGLRFIWGNALHHAQNSGEALVQLARAHTLFEQAQNPLSAAACLRVRAEIGNHLERYEDALADCEACLVLRRAALSPHSPNIADALFWKGITLLHLNRTDEVAPCMEEALQIWQENNELTGIGFCLRVIGRLRAAQNAFGEARAHITHAILLHEQMNDMGSRRAAIEAMGDVFVLENRFADALPLYAECLQGHEAEAREKAIARLRGKMEGCDPGSNPVKTAIINYR